MRKQITHLRLTILVVVALKILTSCTSPTPLDDSKQSLPNQNTSTNTDAKKDMEEPKQYIIVSGHGDQPEDQLKDLEEQVNKKISEGWRLQGGVDALASCQAMVK